MLKHTFIRKIGHSLSAIPLGSRRFLGITLLVSFLLLSTAGVVNGLFAEIHQNTSESTEAFLLHKKSSESADGGKVIVKSQTNRPVGDKSDTGDSSTSDNTDEEEDSDDFLHIVSTQNQQNDRVHITEKPQSRISFFRTLPLYLIFHSWKHFLL